MFRFYRRCAVFIRFIGIQHIALFFIQLSASVDQSEFCEPSRRRKAKKKQTEPQRCKRIYTLAAAERFVFVAVAMSTEIFRHDIKNNEQTAIIIRTIQQKVKIAIIFCG